MKTILTIILAAVLLLSMLGGCAKDMSGETRPTATPAVTATPKPTAAPKATATPAPKTDDTTADGVIDEGKDAVDGVVGAGEEAVNDIVDAGEDMVDDITGNDKDENAKETASPTATPKPNSVG